MAVQVNPVFSENGDRQAGGFCPKIFNAGFDIKFICKHCHCILRDPVQSACGHRFCCSCRDEILAQSAQVNCPACLEEQVDAHEIGELSMSLMFPDNAVKREMSVMPTSCAFPGCNWRGRFKEYEVHERNCEFRQISCGLCAQAVTNGHIEEHKLSDCPQRQVTCDFCQLEIVFARLQSHHDVCEKFPITCDRCSKPNIIRELVS
jgi:TNF receptor-associated factor 2